MTIVLSPVGIILATLLLSWAGRITRRYLEKISGDLFVVPFIIFLLIFAFIYFGARGFENMRVVDAIFSGIVVRQVLPEKFIQQYKKPVFFVGNIFLGPFFFLSLGGGMALNSLLTYPFLILAIMVISLLSRMAISYLLFRRVLGKRPSLVMGIGCSKRYYGSLTSPNPLATLGSGLFSVRNAATGLSTP